MRNNCSSEDYVPVRLLRVIRSTDPESGGPIEGLIRTSEILMRAGHEVEVVSLESQETAARRSLPFPVIGLGRGLGRYGYNYRLVPWMKQNIRRFDAVVLHGLWNYSSFGAWRALKHSDIPYYIFVHGMMDPWFRREYPIKHIAKQLFWLIAEGRVLRDAKATFFTSEDEMVRARHVFKGFSYNERVVLYGTADPQGDAVVEKAMFTAAFPALMDRRFLIFVGRIHPKKGCDLLVRAFAEMTAEIDQDIDLVMAGPDQLGWLHSLNSMATQLGIAKRIHWTGMLKGQIKWGALRSAEAAILPSHQENFGIVVAEAMACSTPVLISNKVNIWREVRTSGAGLVEPDTLEGTRGLIRNFFLLSPEKRIKMKVAARNEFLRSFEIHSAADDLMRQLGFSNDPTEMIAGS